MSLSENRCPLFRDMRQPTRRPMQGDAPCARKPGCRIPGNVLSFAPINNVQGRRRWVVGSATENSASSQAPKRLRLQRRFPPRSYPTASIFRRRRARRKRSVERRIIELADVNGKRLGLSRRQFLQTGCGMAAAFLAMNEIYGGTFSRSTPAEAREPELMQARAQGLAGQFIFDVQTHFVRDDFDHKELLRPGQVRQRALEPEAEGEGRLLARPLQVPELREGDLLRQRHQHGALERRAVRRSELVVSVQRADRQGARAASTTSRARAACWRTPSSRPSSPAGWTRSTRRSTIYKPDSWKAYTIGDPLAPSKYPVAARRRAGDVSVLREGGEGRHHHASASTRACCRPITRSRSPACGNTQPPGTSARRPRTGRR